MFDESPWWITKLVARLVIRVLAFALSHGGNQNQLWHAYRMCFPHRTPIELDELWRAAQERAAAKTGR